MQSKDTSSKTKVIINEYGGLIFLSRRTAFLFLILLSVIFINIACNSSDSPQYDASHLKGYVLDSATLTGIKNVTITLPDLSRTAQSSDSGYFEILNIQMPRDQYGTTVTASKTGYGPITQAILLLSTDTTHVTLVIASQK